MDLPVDLLEKIAGDAGPEGRKTMRSVNRTLGAAARGSVTKMEISTKAAHNSATELAIAADNTEFQNLAHYSKLKRLDVYGPVLRVLDAIPPSVEHLNFAADSHVSPYNFPWGKFPNLDSIALQGKISAQDLDHIPSSVKHLDLRHCKVDGLQLRDIADLARRPLISLHFQPFAELHDRRVKNGDEIALLLAKNPSLRSLSLSAFSVNGEGITEVGARAFARGSLSSLDLSNHPLGNAGALALASSDTLTELHVDNAQIGDAGTKALAEIHTLGTPSLSRNRIGAAGATELGASRSIRTLSVSNCELNGDAAAALLENPVLETLSISGNRLGTNGFPALRAIGNHPSITSLEAKSNSIDDEGAVELARCAKLRSLDVSLNRIGDRGAHALAETTSLVELNVHSNSIGDSGATALAKSPSLTSLWITSNPDITYRGERALNASTRLKTLDIDPNILPGPAAYR